MEDLYKEVAEQLPGWTDGVKDLGELPGRFFERLDGIIVTAQVLRVRSPCPIRHVEVLFADEMTVVDLLVIGGIAHRPRRVRGIRWIFTFLGVHRTKSHQANPKAGNAHWI